MTQILYFSTALCQPCKAFKPIVQEVAAETGKSVQFIDAQQNKELANQYGISSVPAIVVLHNGQIVMRNVGAMSKQQLVNQLNKFI